MTRDEIVIRIWHFEDAPQEYQDLSGHGGDEDYIMHVPPPLIDNSLVDWIATEGHSFGCCDVSEHDLEDGSRIYIGAHA